MPTVAGWLGATRPRTHRLTPWRTDWSSQTGASQLGILHGTNHDVPAFRWYEKDTGRVMVCNRPASAAELQRRAIERTGDGGLLTVDGASRGNLFSGGADQLALVLSMAARRGRAQPLPRRATSPTSPTPPTPSAPPCPSSPKSAARSASRPGPGCASERPRVERGGLYPFIRAFATVVERDVVVAAVIGDMLAGRTAVYADLVAYDEVAHHSGPHSRDAAKVLERLDRSLALIAKVAEHAPRAYRIVLLSDHGQSPGETFAGALRTHPQGPGAGRLRAARAAPGAAHPQRRRGPRRGTGDALRSARRPERAEERTRIRRAAPTRSCSPPATSALISFPDVAAAAEPRADRRAATRRCSRTLANHPGIGFLLVRSEEHGSRGARRATARRCPSAELTTRTGPAGRLRPGRGRRRTPHRHASRTSPTSWSTRCTTPTTGDVHAFEEQIGSHGGLGGEQSQPFLLSPLDLSAPVADGRRNWSAPSGCTGCCGAGCASARDRRCRSCRTAVRAGRAGRARPGAAVEAVRPVTLSRWRQRKIRRTRECAPCVLWCSKSSGSRWRYARCPTPCRPAAAR